MQFCEEHDLVLVDEPIMDLGMSAHKGANYRVGNLSLFLDACVEGKVEQGSTLIVESLDRISRDRITDAMAVFLQIASYVNIGIAQRPFKLYTKEQLNDNRNMTLIGAILDLMRAHEESEIKSERVGAAWKNKKRNASNLKPITKQIPLWLDIKDGKIVKNPVKCKVIEDIYEWSIKGAGVVAITRRLTESGIEPFGNAKMWYPGYVNKLLTNKSVCGHYQPRNRISDSKRVPDGKPIKDYYPVVISEGKYLEARFAANDRKNKGGLKVDGGGKRCHNIFTHLLECGVSGHSIQYSNKGRYAYLIPAGCRSKKLHYFVAWEYGHFERVMFENLFTPGMLALVTDGVEPKESRVPDLQSRVDALDLEEKRLIKMVKMGLQDASALYEEINSVQAERAQAREILKEEERLENNRRLGSYAEIMGEFEGSAERIRESEVLRVRFQRLVVREFKSILVYFEGRFEKWNNDRPKIASALKLEQGSPDTEDRVYLRKLVSIYKLFREIEFTTRNGLKKTAFDQSDVQEARSRLIELNSIERPQSSSWLSPYVEDLNEFFRTQDEWNLSLDCAKMAKLSGVESPPLLPSNSYHGRIFADIEDEEYWYLNYRTE